MYTCTQLQGCRSGFEIPGAKTGLWFYNFHFLSSFCSSQVILNKLVYSDWITSTLAKFTLSNWHSATLWRGFLRGPRPKMPALVWLALVLWRNAVCQSHSCKQSFLTGTSWQPLSLCQHTLDDSSDKHNLIWRKQASFTTQMFELFSQTYSFKLFFFIHHFIGTHSLNCQLLHHRPPSTFPVSSREEDHCTQWHNCSKDIKRSSQNPAFNIGWVKTGQGSQ